MRAAIRDLRAVVADLKQAPDDFGGHKADAIKAKFMGEGFAIFAGPIKDNKGATVIAAGTMRGQTDIELEKMGYLVEGVIGSTS